MNTPLTTAEIVERLKETARCFARDDRDESISFDEQVKSYVEWSAADRLEAAEAELAKVREERDRANKLVNRYAWERDNAREERDSAERKAEAFWKPQLDALRAALAEKTV